MKRALVLSGGGARGSYEVGVWKALRKLRWRPQIVTGCSVGAIVGAAVVCNKFDDAVRVFSTLEQRSVVTLPRDPKSIGDVRRFMADAVRGGGLDVTPLEQTINSILDEDKMRRGRIGYGLVTVRRADMQPLEVTLDDIPKGRLADYILASAAVFPAFRARKLDDGAYIDGGFYDNLPIELAEDMGAVEVTAVDLQGPGVRRSYDGSLPVRYIRCFWPLGSHLRFEGEVARRNINLGYLDGLKAFRAAEGRAYTFPCGGFEEFIGRNPRFYGGLSAYFDSNPTAARSARQALLKHTDYRRTPRNMALAFCELTARVFGMSPECQYDVDEMNRRLLDCAEAARGNGGNGSLLKGEPSGAAAAAICGELLNGARRRAISSLAATRAAEYAAGCYLAALKTTISR